MGLLGDRSPWYSPAGEYIASVILENDEPVKGKGSIALDQVVRQAVAVAVAGTLQPGLAIGAGGVCLRPDSGLKRENVLLATKGRYGKVSKLHAGVS